MNRSDPVRLVALCSGIEPRLLAIAIAGARLGEHLARNAAPHFRSAEPAAAAADPQAQPLYVRADAWLSARAFGSLAARLAQRDAQTVLVAAPDGRMLAACLCPSDAGLLGADLQGCSCDDALERIRLGASRPRTFDAAELDPSLAPRIVADLLEAARLERQISFERARSALLAGVRIRDPERISIRGDLACGAGVEIDVDVIIEGRVRLGDRVLIGAGCIISDAAIGDDARIHPYSIVERAVVGSGGFVGPYGRLRPGAVIGDRVQIGNFVEIKQSEIGDACRINHLAFVGDATLGAAVTIGAGVITCNHDGRGVQPTRIGAGAYVGSGTQLVAPLEVGANALIGAGSTITEDAPAGKLTIARARQATLESWSPPKGEEDRN